MKNSAYSKRYYENMSAGSLSSAHETIPVILEYISPASVVDVGCGVATWLSAWEKHGVTDIQGIDGDHVQHEQLLIDPAKFLAADLNKEFSLPGRFDLVMSLEVAEHLQPGSAQGFVRSLCKLGDVIIFSAAMPHQGGTLHYNEQYPSYWMTYFAEHDFSPYDVLRPRLWHNKRIDTSYRQNILVFVNNKVKDKYRAITTDQKEVLPLIHPEFFEFWMRQHDGYKHSLRTPFHAGWFFIRKWARSIRNIFGHGNKG